MRFLVVENFSDKLKEKKGLKGPAKRRKIISNQFGGALRARYRPASTLQFLKSMSR